jgi:hypothetical protein
VKEKGRIGKNGIDLFIRLFLALCMKHGAAQPFPLS